MKKYLLCFSLLLALIPFAHAQQALQLREGDVVIKNILPSGQKTPEYQLAGGQTKRFKNLTWLEVEVQYDTLIGPIDELTFEYTILFNGFLLTGSTTYVNIAKGPEHYAVVYVSPQSIDKLMEGRPFTNSAIGNIEVKVTRQGQVLADKAMKNIAFPNVAKTAGLILGKQDTPFAPLYWDRYESLKPTR